MKNLYNPSGSKSLSIKLSHQLKLCFFFLVIFMASSAVAQKTATSSGNWSNPAIWSPAGVPTASDSVIIPINTTVDVDITTATCAGITFNAPTTTTTVNANLNITGSNSLQVNGDITFIYNAAGTYTNTLNVGNGTVNCTGSLVMDVTGTAARIRRVVVNNGSLTCASVNHSSTTVTGKQINLTGSGTITVSGTISRGAQWTVNNNGVINVGGGFNVQGVDFSPGTGTVNFTSLTGNQNLNSGAAHTFFNVNFMNTSGANLASHDIVVANAMTMASSGSGTLEFVNTRILTINGTIECNNGSIGWNAPASTTGRLIIQGSSGGSAGNIRFTPGKSVYGLTMNRTGTNPSVNFLNDVTIGTTTTSAAGLLTLTSGTIHCGSNFITLLANPQDFVNFNLNANSNNYFSFQPGGQLRWNRTTASSAAVVGNNLKIPIGFQGAAVNGFRGIDIVPQGANSVIDVTFSFINHSGGLASPTNVPTLGNNRAGYILNINIANGGFGTGAPNVTLRYANADFNAGAPTIGNVHPFTFTAGSWTQQSQNGNSSGALNTITKTGFAFNSGNTAIVLGVEGGTDLGGAPTTFTWSGLGSSGTNNWFDPSNWIEGAVPNASSAEVTINYSGSNNPDLNGNVDVNFINLINGTLNINTAGVLNLSGDLTVTNGSIVLSATGVINGVAGNSFSLGAGATYTVLRTTAPWFPTNMSLSLNNNSTVQYGTAANTYTLNNSVPQNYGNLIIGSNVTLAASHPFTVNGNLSILSSRTLNDNGNTITVKGNITNGSTSTSTHTSSGSGKILLDGGSPHTISGGVFGNLELNDAAGATTLGNTTISAANALILNTGVFTITGGTVTINGSVNTINGTIAGGTANSRLTIAGTSGGNAGTLNFSGSAPQLSHFVMNRTGANASVTIGTNLSVLTTVTFTNGTVNIGSNTLTYLGTAGDLTGYTPNAGLNNYVAIAPGGWFQWNSGSNTSGTTQLRFPVGPAGAVNGFRGVFITPNTSATVNTRIGFINHSGGPVSATNVPEIGNNRSNFIINLEMISGNFGGSPTITLRYANADFSGGAPAIASVDPYSFIAGQWTKQDKNSFTSGAINTITKDVFPLLAGNNAIVLGVDGGANLGGAPTDFEWVGNGATGTNNWFSAANWNPVGIPDASDANITINYAGSNQPQLNAPVNVNNVNLVNGTLTLNASANMNINGDFTIGTGTFSVNATANFSGVAGKTFSVGAGGTYIIGRTSSPWYPSNMMVNISTTSTVQYGTGAVTNNLSTAIPQSYGNLIINSNVNLPPNHPITVFGDLSINLSRTLNDNGNTITVKGNITNGSTTTSVHSSTGSGKILLDGGTQHTISGGVFGNLELNDAAGAIIQSTTRVTNTLFLTNGALTNTGSTVLTVEGNFNSVNGTLTGGGFLTVLGTSGGSAGTVNFSGSAPQLGRIVLNRTGANSSLTFGTDVTINGSSGIQLNNGTLNIGANNLSYIQSNFVFTSYTPNSSFDNYIAIGNGGSFQWNASSNIGTGELRFPIGPAGAVSGYRAIHITPNTSQLVNARFSFSNHTGGPVSSTNVPTAGNNRSNYIANIEILSGSFGSSPTLQMRYQNSDLNGPAPALSDVHFYRFAGYWQKVDQTSNVFSSPFNVLTRVGFPLNTGNNRILIGVEGSNDLNLLLNDVGITAINVSGPITPSTPIPVNVEVSNFGTNSVTSFSIVFTINGNPTTLGPFSVNIAPGASQSINIGNFTFPASGFSPYVVSAETTLPNNTTDGNPANDLFTVNNFYTCFSGNITVGAGGNFTTITQAFNALSIAGICGAVNISLISNSYPGETFPLVLNNVGGANATNTISIKPAIGANPNISGSAAGALIQINGTNFVTIDGSNDISAPVNTVCPRVTASRSITFSNTSTAANTRGILISNASNVIVRNTTISCSSVTSVGILSNGTGNNNQFINNTINNANVGIASIGVSAANKKNGTLIQLNVLNTRNGGILAGFENGISVAGNRISTAENTQAAYGISLGYFLDWTLVNGVATGSDVTNATVEYNEIFINRSSMAFASTSDGTGSLLGIGVSAVPSGTTTIQNNLINFRTIGCYDANSIGAGILIGGGSAAITNVYYNTVRWSFISSGSNASPVNNTYGIAAMTSPGAAGSTNILNNIVVNQHRSTGGTRHVAIGLGYTNLSRTFINHNNYWVTNPSPDHFIGQTGSLFPSSGTYHATLSDWQAATNRDNFSVNINPTFVSPNPPVNIRLANAPSNAILTIAGTPIPSVTNDIDCEPRNSATSSIGGHNLNVTNKVWVGGTAGNPISWYEPNNWAPVGVPIATDVALIANTPNNPVVGSGPGAVVSHLTVAPGATLTVESNGALTVQSHFHQTGNFVVQPGGAFVQPDGALYSGLGTNRVRLLMPGNTSQYRMLGAAINNMNTNTIGGVFATGTNGSQIIPLSSCSPTAVASNSPNGSILELRDIPENEVIHQCSQSLWFVKNGGNLENGRGYALRTNGGQTIEFAGNRLNNGTIIQSGLTRQSGTVNDHVSPGNISRGVHLLANPYPSPIQIQGLTHLVPNGFDGAIYVFNNATNSWMTYLPSQTVTLAAGQGFQIRKSTEGGTASFPFSNSMRVATAGATLFSEETHDWYDYRLTMKVTGNNKTDDAVVFFNSHATPVFDPAYDANKMSGAVDQPLLFTMAANERMYYNGLPLLTAPITVPLSFYAGIGGQYLIDFSDLESLPATSMVYLEDKQTGIWTNLRHQSTYSFMSSANDDIHRFVLHFEPPVMISTQTESCMQNDGQITFVNPSNETWNLALSNGNQISHHTLLSGVNVIDNLTSGDYHLALSNGSYSVIEIISIEAETNLSIDFTLLHESVVQLNQLIEAMVVDPVENAEYTWYINNLQAGNGHTVSFMVTQQGEYDLRLDARMGNCRQSAMQQIVVQGEQSTGTVAIADEFAIRLFPNPARESVNLVWNEKGALIERIVIADISGKQIRGIDATGLSQGNQLILDIQDLAEGIYLIQISGKNMNKTLKLSVVK